MHIYLSNEVWEYKDSSKKSTKLHTVIATRKPVETHTTIPHKNVYEHVTVVDDRYKNFKSDSAYIDISVGQKKVRIFNAHLKCVAGPYHRLSQFRELLENLSSDRENIICGDFNTFGHPLLSIFVWKYFGYRLREVMLHERSIMQALIDLYQFKNPFKGMVTFTKIPMQFDYILVPATMSICDKKRLRRNGSDHFPLLLEVE